MHVRQLLSAILLAVMLLARAQAESPIRGVPAQTFMYEGPVPIRMPTAVTIGPDSAVYVVDGVNDRIVAFDRSGAGVTEIRRVGDESLAAPLSAKIDSAGRLWIADSGNRRVLVRAADGSLHRILEVPLSDAGVSADITDVAPSADGQFAWVADNDNARIHRIRLMNGQVESFGNEGEGRGELHYPFALAVAGNGDVFVTDMINGRVQPFDSSGRALNPLGAYGVELGNLYRPKGIAIDADGRVWVSDSTLGVIQVFERDGGLVDVLRDSNDKPLRFDFPSGLAFDAAGDLYVAEVTADRVRKVAITRDTTALKHLPPRSPSKLTQNQPRLCTACHLDWLQPLAQGRGTELIEPLRIDRSQPYSSRAEVCFSCHDGSVVDSRRDVWVEHGHRVGLVPPEGFQIPNRLPLSKGEIVCRTCHSAHTRGGSGDVLKTAVFLRVESHPSELCVSCHSEQADPAGGANHPATPTASAGDSAFLLAENGARDLSCLSCHMAHGAASAELLQPGAATNQLCTDCHQVSTAMHDGPQGMSHPIDGVLEPNRRESIAAVGGRVGSDGSMLCLSCHTVHAAKGAPLLNRDPSGGQFCTACHADQGVVLESPHDLSVVAPAFSGPGGRAVSSAGPCSACHTTHQPSWRAVPDELAASAARCLTCHSDSGVACERRIGSPNHPAARCEECHNPHRNEHGAFLVAAPDDVCARCHAAQMRLVDGVHDSHAWAEAGSAGAAGRSRCLACHRPHGDERHGLFRVAPAAHESGSDAACVACHPEAAASGLGSLAMHHPRDVVAGANGARPHSMAPNGIEQIGCASCHDPHGSANEPRLLRVESGGDGGGVCVQCHFDMRQIGLTQHAPSQMLAGENPPLSCAPCHLVHAPQDAVQTSTLWPVALFAAAPELVDGSDQFVAADRHCNACHANGGLAAAPRISAHPRVAMYDPTGRDGGLPLFNERGVADAMGALTCQTCHVPHGRPIDNAELAGLSAEEARLLRLMVRPFASPNVCTNCHGEDGRRRFLYFHDPERRGPVSGELNSEMLLRRLRASPSSPKAPSP